MCIFVPSQLSSTQTLVFDASYQTLKQMTLVSLFQAGGSLYEQFDRVYVVHAGHIASFGLIDQENRYFVDLGATSVVHSETKDRFTESLSQI